MKTNYYELYKNNPDNMVHKLSDYEEIVVTSLGELMVGDIFMQRHRILFTVESLEDEYLVANEIAQYLANCQVLRLQAHVRFYATKK